MRTQGYCSNCRKSTLHEVDPDTTHHVAHLLATLFMCGVWLPVWMLIVVFADARYLRCTACGFSAEEAEARKAGIVGWLMKVLQVAGIAVLTVVMLLVALLVVAQFGGMAR